MTGGDSSVQRGRRGVLAAIAVAAAAAAWLTPGPKPEAVAGRLDYPQFLTALGATLAGVVGAISLVLAGRRRRAFLGNAALLALGCGVALLMAEFAAWALPTRSLMDNPWYQATGEGMMAVRDLPYHRPPRLNWTGLSRGDLAMDDDAPDPEARTVTFSTDSEGFRNTEASGPADIVFLGDSFTEAGNVPIEEAFPSLVGSQGGYRVRNLGVAGFTPPTELVVLKTFALKHAPRVVVWQIAESNDLNDAVRYVKWLSEGRPDFREEPRRLPNRTEAWRRRSPTRRLFDLLRTPTPWPVRGTFLDAGGRAVEVRFEDARPGPNHSPAGHPGWPVMRAALEEGIAILAAHEIEPLVLLIPMKFRALAASMRFDRLPAQGASQPTGWLESWRPEQDLRDEQTMAHHLRLLCGATNARFVDATPSLRAAAASGELPYLPMDTHLSPAGHRRIAELILKALAGRQQREHLR